MTGIWVIPSIVDHPVRKTPLLGKEKKKKETQHPHSAGETSSCEKQKVKPPLSLNLSLILAPSLLLPLPRFLQRQSSQHAPLRERRKGIIKHHPSTIR